MDTSMGLTPLEGLIMGTRSGDLDPAILEFIANKENKIEVVNILNKESGVLDCPAVFLPISEMSKPQGQRATKRLRLRWTLMYTV